MKSCRKILKKHGSALGISSQAYRYASQTWSKTIKNLDNNMCKLCDSKENLHVHHIQPKAKFSILSLDLNNGVTLCKPCHFQIHFGLITGDRV